MGKIIAAINMTLDGFCDHTVIPADEEIHLHYADLINKADIILYGRITYQLMEFWRDIVENPSGEKTMDYFAIAMDNIPKIVFSHTLKNVDWHSAKLSNAPIEEVVSVLRQTLNHGSKDIMVGSRSVIIQLMKLNLIDEYQLCIHPVIAGSGLPLFENIHDRTVLKLTKTKIFSRGAVILYYEPIIEKIKDH